MNLHSITLKFVSGTANLFACLLRIAIVALRPGLRFVRLVSLRSRVDGHIPVSTQFDGPVRTAGRVHLHLGEHCRLGRDVFFETEGDGVIRIGDNTRINSGVFIVAHQEVCLGNNCLVGEYVSIRDANHGIASGELIVNQPHEAAAIRIGDDVWIGRGSVILKGRQIGDGAVIGANSVVTLACECNEVVAGAPIRRIRLRKK